MSGGGSWRIKRKVIRHYNRLAPIYDTLYAHEQSQKIEKVLHALDFSPLNVILDAGCGTGILFKYIANLAGAIIGVDIARGPLEIAKKMIKDSRLDTVFLVRADTDFLPFKSGIFDKVFAITLLQNVPNPILTLNEVARVAKRRSVFVITGLKKVFSRESFLETLRKAGLKFILLDDENDIKCHVAICYKGGMAKSINKRIKDSLNGGGFRCQLMVASQRLVRFGHRPRKSPLGQKAAQLLRRGLRETMRSG